MKFGCVVTPRDFGAVRKIGYDYAELSGRALQAMTPVEFRELKSLLFWEGLPCRGLNAYCPPEIVIAGPGFSDDKAGAYAQSLLDRAAELGVAVIGVGSPNSRTLPAGFSRALAWEQTLRFFDVTARVFEPAGITVCVEALAACYTNHIATLDEACRIVRQAARPNLKAVIDFYNMEHNGEADIPLEAFAPDIAHAHISDDAGSPLKRWFLDGSKYAKHIQRLRRLYACGYHGGVTVEIDLPVEAGAAAETLKILQEAAENPA
ncbi:MAG TPA: sugar phosphate isomerase/epimerase family protein [Candidatus Limiplasma sp.]|nr:sugar phosphate isomerase/epimerase family protein [Candidatus Limiplasma sp.]